MSGPADTSDLWWKTAVVYCLDVETYHDSNGDGIGDFAGLANRIDYLAELGVTCLWLMPFYPTPDRDDGYDITDFYTVDPRLGTLGDFVEFIRTAHDRGIRVIADLVVNHTPDSTRGSSPARAARPTATGTGTSGATTRRRTPRRRGVPRPGDKYLGVRTRQTEEYYLHRFYRLQPDLDFANPAVRNEPNSQSGFWPQLGIDGFRIDAVPFLSRTSNRADPCPPRSARLPAATCAPTLAAGGARRSCSARRTCRDDQQRKFFGDGTRRSSPAVRLHHDAGLWLSMAAQGARPLARRSGPVRRSPRSASGRPCAQPRRADPGPADSERARRGVQGVRPEKSMQVYNRGLRRRLAAMLDGDTRRSGWSAACCSPCRAPRRSSTATRSAWGRTSMPRAGSRCTP